MPNTPVILGCARPGGEHKSETDILAIRAGVSGIAYPSEEGYNFAKKAGLNIKFSKECCALTYKALVAQEEASSVPDKSDQVGTVASRP